MSMSMIRPRPMLPKPHMTPREPRTRIKVASSHRAAENRIYLHQRPLFIEAHPWCPKCAEEGRRVPATQIHHSAHREGLWLLLKRYWIGLCFNCHGYVTDNQTECAGYFVRINQDYKTHVARLISAGIDIDDPIFYKTNP